MNAKTILLSIDSLRSDRFSDRYFSKCWEIIDDEFCFFPEMYSHGTATPLAFPGLVTGETVIGDGTLASDVETLGESHTGMSVALTNNPHLSSEKGYARGIDRFDQSASENTVISRLKTLGRRSNFLESVYDTLIQAAPVQSTKNRIPYTPAELLTNRLISELQHMPAFLWGHYMDPHAPHTEQTLSDRDIETTSTDLEELSDAFHSGRATQNQLQQLEELYDQHIRYLDTHLGRFLSEAQLTSWWDEALVVVVGDHGEAFGDEGQQAHPWGADPKEAVIRTPLAVKFPNSTYAGERFDHLIGHKSVYEAIIAHTSTSDTNPEDVLSTNTGTPIVSKSNSAIRVTSEEGWLIRRRDGTEASEGDITGEMYEIAESESFPEASALNGDIPGMRDDGLAERLEALGYR